MKLELQWQKPKSKPISLLKTNDAILVFSIISQAISEKAKRGQKIEGNLVIIIGGGDPDIFTIVKNGREDKSQEIKFVGMFF